MVRSRFLGYSVNTAISHIDDGYRLPFEIRVANHRLPIDLIAGNLLEVVWPEVSDHSGDGVAVQRERTR